MKTFNDYLDALDLEHGAFPQDSRHALRVTVSKLSVDYLRTVSELQGNNLTWHINKAIEMYIQSLGSAK